jgi:ABC-2 type transport system permease protein
MPAESKHADVIGSWRFFSLMLNVQRRIAAVRLKTLRKESRLMMGVLGSFIAGYLVFGFLIFYAGLNYLNTFPMVGQLLSRRVLFLIFAFFLVMLLFSNLIVGYSSLFRSRETTWFLTLPISSRDIYRWKLAEHLSISSWALLFFTAPLLVAYAIVLGGGFLFVFAAWLLLVPFVIVPAVCASFCALAMARFFNAKVLKWLLWAGGLLALMALLWNVRTGSTDDIETTTELISINSILKQSEVVLSDALPSAWFSRSLIALVQRFPAEALFYGLLLFSYALVFVSLASRVASRLFYGSWMKAAHQDLRARLGGAPTALESASPPKGGLLEKAIGLLPVERADRALILKDQLLFWRDPSQWSQFLIFFGLLGIYVFNLRNVTVDVGSPFWSMLISYLNLGSSALTLSTLTTRFVFPQFSLEGRRLWILGMSPMGLERVVLSKFWASALGTGGLTVILMTASSMLLKLPVGNTLIFCAAVALLATGLSGLAVGLGTLFPNLREENPAKVVSGFGGTLCLVLSFVFIVVMISILAIPAFFQNRAAAEPLFRFDASTLLACLGVTAVGIGTAVVPMMLALKKISRMEI